MQDRPFDRTASPGDEQIKFKRRPANRGGAGSGVRGAGTDRVIERKIARVASDKSMGTRLLWRSCAECRSLYHGDVNFYGGWLRETDRDQLNVPRRCCARAFDLCDSPGGIN